MQTDIHYCATGTERHGHDTNTKWDIFSNAPASGCNSGHLYIYMSIDYKCLCVYVYSEDMTLIQRCFKTADECEDFRRVYVCILYADIKCSSLLWLFRLD